MSFFLVKVIIMVYDNSLIRVYVLVFFLRYVFNRLFLKDFRNRGNNVVVKSDVIKNFMKWFFVLCIFI